MERDLANRIGGLTRRAWGGRGLPNTAAMAGPERIGGARRPGRFPRGSRPGGRAAVSSDHQSKKSGRWDAGVGVSRLPVPVVSVGNLSVGRERGRPPDGWPNLVRVLQAAGRRPCVAMRGYVRSSHVAAAIGGGENGAVGRGADVHGRCCRRAGGWRSRTRAAGVRELLAAAETFDCVVLDDGFQHRRLGRDLDVVLVDASRSPFEDRLLPAGGVGLREPGGVAEAGGRGGG